ncbi:Arylacetamide deacetylase-like 4, partial [Heterocephalus glaber]
VLFFLRYRQLPDHHYPVIYQDCLNATMKFLKGAGAYGVEPSQVVICGESIGASTVAMVSQALAGRTNLPQIRAQVLISPVLQLLNLQLPSFREMKNVSFLTLDIFMTCLCRYLDNDLFWQAALMKGACILPEDWKKYWKWLSSDNISNRLKNKDQEPQFPGPFNESAYLETKQWLYIKNSALLEDDEIIAQLPEAFLVSYGYDILRDDTMLYKKHLEDRGGGGPMSWYHVEGGFHGCVVLFDRKPFSFPCSQDTTNGVVSYIKGI